MGSEDQLKNILNFFYELGQLKIIPRSGPLLLGIKNPESIADHSLRASYIAFVLAKLEGADPHKSALITAFHDLPETRIGDLNKVAQRYITTKKEIENKILKEQLSILPEDIAQEFRSLLSGFADEASMEHTIAKDASYLECAIQAKEYIDQGYAAAQNWIDNTKKGCLVTSSAKKFLELIEKTDSRDWYIQLKRIRR